eukprot:2648587-Rhodomonas_salina.1
MAGGADAEGGSEDGLVRKWNPNLIPFNESSIDWWDWAQYQTCFSASLQEGMGVTTSQQRVCDQGVVYSSQIEISTFEDSTGIFDRMVVQSPSLNFADGEGASLPCPPLDSECCRVALERQRC